MIIQLLVVDIVIQSKDPFLKVCMPSIPNYKALTLLFMMMINSNNFEAYLLLFLPLGLLLPPLLLHGPAVAPHMEALFTSRDTPHELEGHRTHLGVELVTIGPVASVLALAAVIEQLGTGAGVQEGTLGHPVVGLLA